MTKAGPKPGICTIALRRYDVFRAIQMAAEAGYSGVEVWGKPPHTPDPIDREHEEAVRQMTHDCGLTVSVFGSYVNVDVSDWQEKAKENLEISCILGAKVMRIWAGSKEPDNADQVYWQEIISRLREFCEMAADVGISLAVEMHGGTLAATVEGSEGLLMDVNHPTLKLNLQLTDFPPERFYRALPTLGPHVVNIHAQNRRTILKNGEKIRELCLIEEGEIDYGDVLKRLSPYGFNGFIEAEFLKGDQDGDEALLDSLRRDAAYLRRICAQVWETDQPIE